MRVLIDRHDTKGELVPVDKQLAVVFVRLDGTHHDPEHKGWWHLEGGLGKCNIQYAPLFKTPEEVGGRVEQTLIGKAA